MNPEPIDIQLPIKELPEQANSSESVSLLDSDVNFITLFRRWQPMGYRVVVNLPFVADDITPLFAIKVGPYIPPNFQYSYQPVMINMNNSGFHKIYHPVYPLPAETSSGTSVTVTRYDSAPTFAILSWAYRFWKGSIKYRLRNVANFIAQGYVFTTLARNLYPIEMASTSTTTTIATEHRYIPGLVAGYRKFQQNSYAMSDLSMFRHIETTASFEYPLPFYDQYKALGELASRTVYATTARQIEPNMGDNFILLCARGGLSSPTAGAQIVFELEYCPGDDFEFSGEYAFSRHGLEIGNHNTSNHYIDSIPDENQGFPFTFPTA